MASNAISVTTSNVAVTGSVSATSNVSCATLLSAGNVIATGGFVPLSALSNSISLASLPGQLLPSAFSNGSIPASAISGSVGGMTTSNFVTVTASNIVSAGNVIASNGYVPLSALSNSVSLATLPGQLVSSSFSSNTIPISALSNVSTAVPMQPVLSYNLPGSQTAQTLLNTASPNILFTTQYNSQGTTGITYNSTTGVFTNMSGTSLVISTSYSIIFSTYSASSVGVRQASINRTSAGVSTSFGDTNVPGGTNGNGLHVCGSATIVLNPLDTLSVIAFQDSGVTQYLYNAQVQLTVLSSPTAIVNAAVQSPMHLSLYGIPSTYSSGSSVANTTWTTTGHYYFRFPSSSLSSVNWTPAYTNTTRLMIPVTGLYALKFTYYPSGTNTGEVFMSKNMNNNSDVDCGDDRLLAIQYTNTTFNAFTISSTVYLLSTDFVSFGIYFGATPGVTGFLSRCTATVTLIQNASSIAANVAGNLKLGTVTNPYGYPVDPAGTSGNISAGNLGMFRNRIINGDMRINQRGVTSMPTANGPSVISYFVDRFTQESYIVTGAITSTVVTLASTDAPFQYGLQYSMRTTTTTAITNYNYITVGCQKIEGYNISDLGWGYASGVPLTVSFWMRANVPAGSVVGTCIRNGTDSVTYNFGATVVTQNAWQYVTAVVPPPPIGYSFATNSSAGIHVSIGATQTTNYGTAGVWNSSNLFGLPSTYWATVGNYVEFTGLQLEKGTIATPFEFRPYAVELQLCQRYYVRISSVSAGFDSIGYVMNETTATFASAQGTVNLPVQMRVAPTYVQNSGAMIANGAIVTSISDFPSFTTLTKGSVNVYFASAAFTAWVFYNLRFNGITNGYIDFTAEI